MYIAIVNAENGKIAKYATFDTQPEADAHAAQYGGFVFNNVNDTLIQYINVDWAGQTATAMTQAEIDAEQTAKLDAQKDKRAASEADKVLGDIQRRALNVMFYGFNQLRAQHGLPAMTLQSYVALLDGAEGDAPITRQQFIDYIKPKL